VVRGEDAVRRYVQRALRARMTENRLTHKNSDSPTSPGRPSAPGVDDQFPDDPGRIIRQQTSVINIIRALPGGVREPAAFSLQPIS
jgi:hypothetical protein